MEENKNTQLDAFLKKQFQDVSLDTPSKDFTSNIMNVLNEQTSSVKIQYKPLISKKIWFVLAVLISGILFVPFEKQEGSLLSKLSFDFSFLDNLRISGLFEGVTLSTTGYFATLSFAIMMFVQLVYLKGYLNKKIAGDL